MAPVPAVDSDRGSESSLTARALPWIAALALHALFVVVAGYVLVAPRDYVRPEEETVRPFLVVRLPPPPPRLEGALADTTVNILPRFRPRIPMPQGVPLIMTRERGSAAEALFRYWCTNRPDTIESTGRMCPSDVPFNGLAALPERGMIGEPDASALLGADDRGYTIDEAAVRRGWVKPKPPSGQDALQGKTDKTTGAKSDEVYGGYPWDVTPTGR
jgi:hypothetical protein